MSASQATGKAGADRGAAATAPAAGAAPPPRGAAGAAAAPPRGAAAQGAGSATPPRGAAAPAAAKRTTGGGSSSSTAKAPGAFAEADNKKRDVVRQGFQKKAGLEVRIAEGLEKGIHQVACGKGSSLAEGSEAFKEYKAQYKRISTHLRRNDVLAKRLRTGELAPASVAAMTDQELWTDSQRKEVEQFQQEGLLEAMGERSEDTSHWVPTKEYTCPDCESTECLYIQNFSNCHGYDEKEKDAAITIRCKSCRRLWKEDSVDGGRLAAGSDSAGAVKELLATSSEAPELWDTARKKEPTWMLPP